MNELSLYLGEYLAFTLDKDTAARVGEELASNMGSLQTIGSSDIRELMRTAGLTEEAALSVKLLSYLYSRSITDKFNRPRRYTEEELMNYASALFLGLSVETVYCLLLDNEGRLIGTEYLGEGTVNSSEVYPRRVLECAVKRGAEGVIIAHNHPRGSAAASSADITATCFINGILRSAGIKLIGHYLVSDSECVKMNMDFE